MIYAAQELETCFARQLLQHRVESKRYLLQCLEVVEHSWISQCNGSLIPNISPLDLFPFKTIYTTGSNMYYRYAVHNITVVHSSTIQHPHSCMYVVIVSSSITPPVKWGSLTIQYLHVHLWISLQLTSIHTNLPCDCVKELSSSIFDNSWGYI